MSYNDKPLDNPLNWSFKVGRLFEIDIRVHIAFVLCAVILVWMEIPRADSGVSWSLGSVLLKVLGMYGSLFMIVLLHEFGHCYGARRTGGEAHEILMWPLGGLAMVVPLHRARAHLITAIAGPMVNVLICLVIAAVLVLWVGGLGAVPWNPLHPFTPVSQTVPLGGGQGWLVTTFGLSYFILLINLAPVFPFDGGRIVQAGLWRKLGFERSMEIATGTGMIGAIVIGVIAMFIEGSFILLGIAVFGYATCWQQRRVLREMGPEAFGDEGGGMFDGYRIGSGDDEPSREPGFFERRRRQKAERKAENDRQELERHRHAVEEVLRKVSATGIDSLTPPERKTLEEETRRQRISSAPALHSSDS